VKERLLDNIIFKQKKAPAICKRYRKARAFYFVMGISLALILELSCTKFSFLKDLVIWMPHRLH
jgi:hypothetical protein